MIKESERHNLAYDRIQRIIAYAKNTEGCGDLRTHLDEWAAYHYGGDLLHGKNGDRQRWFNNPCPVLEGDRLLRHMDWISGAAASILATATINPQAVEKQHDRPAELRLVLDHAIPIATIRAIISDTPTFWASAKMRAFLQRTYRRGIITKAEHSILANKRFGDRMPWHWRDGDNPFARYDAAGIAGKAINCNEAPYVGSNVGSQPRVDSNHFNKKDCS